MYKTTHTNRSDSSESAISLLPLQYDFFGHDSTVYDPNKLAIDQVFDYYHTALKAAPHLLQDLKYRKINPKYVDQYRMGFVDRTLGVELQSSGKRLESHLRGQLQRLQLLKHSGHEFLRGSIVVPHTDQDGNVVGAYGRRPRQQSRSQAYHLYWNAQQSPLFNVNCLQESEDLYLCKSSFDSLTLLTAGFEQTIATMGIEGFNDAQLSSLEASNVRRVYIAFDNTPRANHYALLIAQALDALGVICYRVKLPRGHDVNSFAMMQSDVAGSFHQLVDEAIPFKQQYGKMVYGVSEHWLEQLRTLDDGIQFYLDESRQAGKSSRTLSNYQIHLERFQEYCQGFGVDRLVDLKPSMLEAYQHYLQSEKNVFTGQTISLSTQVERMEAVSRMLARLYYYGVIPEPLNFVRSEGVVH